jgi:UDP-N-acetyl-D-mannosaminuronic acid transferase (WecB/TagA/CpsF family)
LPLLISKKFKNIRKVAGRNLVRNLKLKREIKHIHILGNLEQEQKKYLNKLTGKKIYFTKLPFENVENLAKICGSLKKGVLYIVTLPTPKQEQLAEILSIKNNHYKILLLGGAINILTGYEKEVPEKIRYFEFIWRLRFETLKRLKRLLFTSVSFLYHYLFDKKYRKLLN